MRTILNGTRVFKTRKYPDSIELEILLEGNLYRFGGLESKKEIQCPDKCDQRAKTCLDGENNLLKLLKNN